MVKCCFAKISFYEGSSYEDSITQVGSIRAAYLRSA